MLEQMQNYIRKQDITVAYVVHEMMGIATDVDDLVTTLEAIELEVMLSIYCESFDPRQKANHFYEQMKAMDVKAIYINKLKFKVFDVIKKKSAEAEAASKVDQFITPIPESYTIEDNNTFDDTNTFAETNTLDEFDANTLEDETDVLPDQMQNYQFFIKESNEDTKKDSD